MPGKNILGKCGCDSCIRTNNAIPNITVIISGVILCACDLSNTSFSGIVNGSFSLTSLFSGGWFATIPNAITALHFSGPNCTETNTIEAIVPMTISVVCELGGSGFYQLNMHAGVKNPPDIFSGTFVPLDGVSLNQNVECSIGPTIGSGGQATLMI